MKVILAGFNVDTETLKQCKDKKVCATPESISAAYARISRSSKPVHILREEARKEVAKARRSNRTIIFEMGHHSIAEHAVFNFDIIGISRCAVEELEKFRLCSYTEKSQRYVTLKGDFVVPKELKGPSYLKDYHEIIGLQNNFYSEIYEKILDYLINIGSRAKRDKKQRKLFENLAKEDARYVLAMATQTQLGATINARNLELMLRRFASHPLRELNELGRKLYNLIKEIAPSIVLFHKANDYDKMTYAELREYARRHKSSPSPPSSSFARDKIGEQDVELVDYTRDGDDKILASILFRVKGIDYVKCLNLVKKMSRKAKMELFRKSCQHMELYDSTLREFEFANLTYSLLVSAACFGQLKRHRIATLTCQEYDPILGCTIPESIRKIGEDRRFVKIIRETERVYKSIERKFPGIGSYILTNAHRKRVLLNVNLRELYHISRLREDPTAQWDIRDKAHKLSKLARKVMPISTKLLGAKEAYIDFYFRLFGKNPEVTEVPQP